MKLVASIQLLPAVCSALHGSKLDHRDYNPATGGVSGSLGTKVSFACTLLQQILDAETLFPGTANYTTENTGMYQFDVPEPVMNHMKDHKLLRIDYQIIGALLTTLRRPASSHPNLQSAYLSRS
jgi:hypothetical protein